LDTISDQGEQQTVRDNSVKEMELQDKVRSGPRATGEETVLPQHLTTELFVMKVKRDEILRLKREIRENLKKQELINKKDEELSEAASEERKKKQKVQEECLKKIMKSKQTVERDAGLNSARKKVGKKREVKKVTARPQTGGGKKDTKNNQMGKRKVPEATDDHGCRHYGLLGLKPLPKNYLESYVKKGGWLYKVPCKDCAVKSSEENKEGGVVDVESLLSIRGRKDVGYYCNCGPTGYAMDDDHDYKALWTCDMILCMNCYNERTSKMNNNGGSRRTRRRSTR
jgi:hypothetical protein